MIYSTGSTTTWIAVWTLSPLPGDPATQMAPPAPVQRAYGLSLAGYIRAQKLQKSVERLTRSDEPILNVAIALGFDSQQSFNRSFKRQYGQAPGRGGGVWVARNRSSFASNAYFAATSIGSCYTVYKYSIARCTMAVETKFVVVRKGEEKMTFASKKEADAHDKLLDMADAFTDWLLQSGMQMDETQAENLGLYLAEQKETVQHILRTSKLPDLNAPAATDKTESDAADTKKIRP
jgi:dsDNA-binding SOS-regulon protein/AraC-like DNA-binding protein